MRKYLVVLVAGLMICQSLMTYLIVFAVKTPESICHEVKKTDGHFHEVHTECTQKIADLIRSLQEAHQNSSPFSSTGFNALLVLYYENTTLRLQDIRYKKSTALEDYYTNTTSYFARKSLTRRETANSCRFRVHNHPFILIRKR